MRKLSPKLCKVCNTEYIPTSPPQKYCSNCQKIAYSKAATERSKQWYYNNHKKALSYRREWYQKNKVLMKVQQKKNIQKRKLRVFNQYNGATCKLCGCTDFDVLVIDHIKGGGTKHRNSFKNYDGQAIYRWLVNNNFPDGFRVLCRNCNWKEHLRLLENKYKELNNDSN